MYPELRQSEWERSARKDPQNLDAWECAQRGWWHWNQFTKDDNETARSYFEKAAGLDPRFADAYSGVAWTHHVDVGFQWTDSPERSIAQLDRAAQKSVALGHNLPLSQAVAGIANALKGQPDKAIPCFQLVVRLDPSFAPGYLLLGMYLARAGRPDEGIENLEKGMRLSPQDPLMWTLQYAMAQAHFAAGRYEEAIEWAERSLQSRAEAGWPLTLATLAASRARLGDLDEARATVRVLLRLNPEFSIAGFKLFLSSAEPEFVERITDGLRKAGLKE
jgi:adenylate cyclase